MLPGIDRLREADKQIPFKSCRMLVLAPTRELAVQIADSAKDYGALAGLKVQCIVGGTSVGKDRNKLHRGTDILVATPGRLLDLIDQKALNLNGIEVLILDRGGPDARPRLHPRAAQDQGTGPERTPDPVLQRDHAQGDQGTGERLLQQPRAGLRHSRKALRGPSGSTNTCSWCSRTKKLSLLEMILKGRHDVPGTIERVLIFTRTKHGADRVGEAAVAGRDRIERDPRQTSRSRSASARSTSSARAGCRS